MTTDTSAIKNKIIAKIQTLTSYFAASAIYAYEPEIGNVTDDPFVVVVDSGNENDYGSSGENRRTFAYKIRIFIERKTRGVGATETLLQQIRDAIIDAFDQDYTLTGSVLLSKATPSRWGYILSDKEYRTADIDLAVQTVYDINP